MRNLLLLLCSSFLIVGLLPDSAKAQTEKREELQKGKSHEAFQHYVNGDLLELHGDIERAISEYQKARTLEPNIPEIRLALARTYFRVKMIDSAKVELQAIERKNNEAYRLLADCYRFRGEVDSALLAYQEAAKLDSTDSRSFWQLAMIWQEKNELRKSIAA